MAGLLNLRGSVVGDKAKVQARQSSKCLRAVLGALPFHLQLMEVTVRLGVGNDPVKFAF